MFRLFISNCLLLISSISFAQVANNVDFLGNWDDNSLPTRSGLNFNDIWGYTDENFNEYGIIGSLDYTHFIDLRNPENPREIARVAGKSRSIWRDIKTYRHYAYSVSDNGGGSLQIFDLSDLPNSVTKVYDSQAFFTRCHNIFIDEIHGRLYAVGFVQGIPPHIIVLDLKENPANPTLLKNITLPEDYVHDIYVRGHIGYASHVYSSKLLVYDLTDVHNVKLLGNLSGYVDAGYNHSSWLSENGNVLVMADENHGLAIKVVDVSDLTDMNVISTFKSTLEAEVATNSIAHNPFIIGNKYAVVSYYHDGVQIYNIEDPANPVRAGYYDTYPTNTNYNGSSGSWGVFPFFPSGNIIASDINNGLFVVKPTFDLGYCRKTVYSRRTFEAGESINTHASESVLLENGFHAKTGSEFKASIQACTTDFAQVTNTDKDVIKDLTIIESIEKELIVYPNPFTNEFKLMGTSIHELLLTEIQLVNNIGQIIQPTIQNCGVNCWSIQANNLSSGVYTILVRKSGGEVVSRKVVKF
ncbi:MAG: choice-of-anchor B family protein [Saprospiraceae bacterium]